MADYPLISVVMPVYNRQAYVGEAIHSILAQTYPHFEFIIVDDGSTDETPRIVRELAERDARIRPFFLEHVGVARASNIGIQQARGEMYARMDSDDISMPQRFAVQLTWMQAQRVEVCGSCMLHFGEATNPLWFPEMHQSIRYELLFRLSLLLPTFMMPINILRAHPFDETVQFDNYAICTALAPHYRLGNVPQILMKHRVHDQQIHIAKRERFERNSVHYRHRCFDDLYPQATPQDRARYERIATGAAFDSPADLQSAGDWLVELAQVPDNLFQQRLAMRWHRVCHVSTTLGGEQTRIYRDYLPRINPAAQPSDYAGFPA